MSQPSASRGAEAAPDGSLCSELNWVCFFNLAANMKSLTKTLTHQQQIFLLLLLSVSLASLKQPVRCRSAMSSCRIYGYWSLNISPLLLLHLEEKSVENLLFNRTNFHLTVYDFIEFFFYLSCPFISLIVF